MPLNWPGHGWRSPCSMPVGRCSAAGLRTRPEGTTLCFLRSTTSQVCPCCGVRHWVCSDCESHDRDVNAARNILRVGLERQPPVVGNPPGLQAGDDVKCAVLLLALASVSAIAQGNGPPPPPEYQQREEPAPPPRHWSRQDEELRRGLDKAHRVIEMLGAIIHEIERRD
jgi:hypothetical protein